MKNTFYLLSAVLCSVAMMSGCKGGTATLNELDLRNVKEFIVQDEMDYHADPIEGFATFSAGNNIVVIPEEISEKQYWKLLTDRYTLQPVAIDTNTELYAELYRLGLQNALRYDSIRGFSFYEDEILLERRGDYLIIPIFHYPETKQYEYVMLAPLTNESFMMTEDGIIDTTYMQSETRAYGTNRIFVGQEGSDSDFHGNLWFYRYNEKDHQMVPICHYVDYRWSPDGIDFKLCWISEDELLVSAVSNGNGRQWVGGYKSSHLAPMGTPVFYKLKIATK